jgi:amino acid transporter
MDHSTPTDDEKQLQSLGYQQELHRRMSGFSNYAISLSIICILAGGVTSFSQGFCAVGGAAIGLGWPLWTLIALIVAATMGQVASAFPTAGGLYHWAAILGGRGWGWVTAWFNLVGLIAVLAAINAGTIMFTAGFLDYKIDFQSMEGIAAVLLVTGSHAFLNHRGIRLTTRLTDFSGYWILIVSILLTVSLLVVASSPDWSRLTTFQNFSGEPGDSTVPPSDNLTYLFLLALLLPAYTLTGFDASAHVSEETVNPGLEVPKGIVRSVLISGLFGWVMLISIVLAMKDLPEAASKNGNAFAYTMKQALPDWLLYPLFVGIVVAQYLCGLATVTSASRMAFAFARDGGLLGSSWVAWVHPKHRTPVFSIWLVGITASLLMILVPYATIAAACAVLLYISYVLPTILGAIAYQRTWKRMGPWNLGWWYRPLAVIAALACLGLLVIGIQPPNDQAQYIVGGLTLLLLVGWFLRAKYRFRGPPEAMYQRLE